MRKQKRTRSRSKRQLERERKFKTEVLPERKYLSSPEFLQRNSDAKTSRNTHKKEYLQHRLREGILHLKGKTRVSGESKLAQSKRSRANPVMVTNYRIHGFPSFQKPRRTPKGETSYAFNGVAGFHTLTDINKLVATGKLDAVQATEMVAAVHESLNRTKGYRFSPTYGMKNLDHLPAWKVNRIIPKPNPLNP